VFILRVVKVLCFETLLQVLILNELAGRERGRKIAAGPADLYRAGLNLLYTEQNSTEVHVASSHLLVLERDGFGRAVL
jgi:hypothetical protein